MDKPCYFWVAIYTDDTDLPQFEVDGSEHTFDEVDWDRVQRFCLVPRKSFVPEVKAYLFDRHAGLMSKRYGEATMPVISDFKIGPVGSVRKTLS